MRGIFFGELAKMKLAIVFHWSGNFGQSKYSCSIKRLLDAPMNYQAPLLQDVLQSPEFNSSFDHTEHKRDRPERNITVGRITHKDN